jgi:hypothetical protein
MKPAPSFHLFLLSKNISNFKIDLRGVKWDGMKGIDLAQDRDQWRAHVNTVINLQVP